jgi:putative SOS response-associated peptidase YedK
LFAFAGLWDRWRDPSGLWLNSCSILTTIPNAVTSAVHDRMPVILDPDSYDLWLDPGMTNVEAVSEILNGAPCPLGHYMEWRRTGRGETVRQYLP